MEVNGKEFMRNVGLEQSKERLIEEQNKLEASKRDSIKQDQNYLNDEFYKEDSAYVDLSLSSMQQSPPEVEETDNINNIFLGQKDQNKNKKKYIVLGIGLVFLFLITILIFRLLSNNDVEEKIENINPEAQELNRDKILNKIDTNEEYQKVIDRKIALDESKNMDKEVKLKEIIIPEDVSNNTPIVIDTPKSIVEPKRDLFGLDNTTSKPITPQSIQNKIEKKIEKPIKIKQKIKAKKKIKKVNSLSKPRRIIAIEPPKETNFTKKNTNVSGYYIQIGAFTKKPTDKLLNSISQKGYNYTVHSMFIKGKTYNKVLIGSYSSRAKASNLLNKVRKDFNNKNAYILKF
jgi:DedD protein